MSVLLSYAEATKKLNRIEKIEHILKLVEPYLKPVEKASLCRVSQSLQRHFSPLLWADPCAVVLRHRLPYHALLRFLQLLTRVPVRIQTRRLCTTLDLRPLASVVFPESLQDAFRTLACDDRLPDLDDGGLAGWALDPSLKALCALLPSVRYLILDGLSSITTGPTVSNKSIHRSTGNSEDRPAVSLLKPAAEDGSGSNSHLMEMSSGSSTVITAQTSLLVLSLSNMPWITTAPLLRHQSLAKIMYLDLSRSLDSRGRPKMELLLVLHGLLHLQYLKILKLQNIGMTDKDFMVMLQECSGRLISLDVSNNTLTDESLYYLCSTLEPNKVPMTEILEHDFFFLADPPVYNESNDHDLAQDISSLPSIGLQPDGVDAIVGILHCDDLSFGHSALDGFAHHTMAMMVGLTHLHLANNDFADAGLLSLQRHSDKLQFLDWGAIQLTPPQNYRDVKNLRFYGAGGWSISDQMISIRQLRIHNSIISGVATVKPIGDYRPSGRNLVRLAEDDFFLHRDVSRQFSLRNQPHLHTLVLTDVPRRSYGVIIDAVKGLLVEAGAQQCKIESAAAAYSRSLRGPKMVTGLRVLRLEFAAMRDTTRDDARAGPSVSGDADADLFSAESEGDFSFFDEEKSISQGAAEQNVRKLVKSDGKRAYDDSKRELLDVFVELKKFRAEVKGRDGAWTGRVEVIM